MQATYDAPYRDGSNPAQSHTVPVVAGAYYIVAVYGHMENLAFFDSVTVLRSIAGSDLAFMLIKADSDTLTFKTYQRGVFICKLAI